MVRLHRVIFMFYKSYGMMHHVRRAAIWTLGHKSKKADGVDAYVDGEYFAQILANSITNCRTSRVWRDPLSTPLT